MISRSLFLFLIASCCLIPANSQEIYDLDRCITVGLERNFSILIARNSQEISENNHTIGNAGFLPVLDVTSRYGGTVNTTTQVPDSGRNIVTKDISNTAGNASVNLGWTIFQGFSAHTTYKKLNELKVLGELNTQMAVEDFIADIAAAFYYYMQQQRLYDNLAYAVSLSRERVRIDAERYLLGASSKLQLLQSQVYLNSDSSRFARQNEVVRSSEIRLSELMALDDLGANIRLKDSLILINASLNYDSLFAEMEQSNTSLQISRRNQTISEYDYKLISARTYPYLNFSSGYGYSWNTFELGTFKNQQIQGANYGLTLGVDLYDGFNRRREKANARLEIMNKEYQYQQVEQQVKADLLNIYYAYQNNLLLLELEEQNLETARENLEIALERYKLGSLSGLDLREVQRSLLDAEERLLSVQYLAKIAEISLLQISGRIMEYMAKI
jgi:outer membrane protein, adhesin transport system